MRKLTKTKWGTKLFYSCLMGAGIFVGSILSGEVQADASQGACGPTATYNYDENTKVMTITGTGTLDSEGWNDTGLTPVEKGMTTLIIGEGITKIEGTGFFLCSNLSSVKFPESLKEIGSWVFDGCPNLKTLTIPKNVTSAKYAFSGSKLESVSFEPGMKTIPSSILSGATELKTVNLPNSVTKIEQHAFSDCKSLTNVTLPWYCTEIESFAFDGCTGLKDVTIYQKTKTIGSMSTFAFEGITPSNLTIHGKNGSEAYKYAKKYGFKWASAKVPALRGITYKKGNLKYKVIKDYIDGKGTVMVTGIVKKGKSVTIPDTVQLESYKYKVVQINSKAFYKNSALKTIKISAKNLKSIGKNAFAKINSKAVIKVPKKQYKTYAKMLKNAGVKGKMKVTK